MNSVQIDYSTIELASPPRRVSLGAQCALLAGRLPFLMAYTLVCPCLIFWITQYYRLINIWDCLWAFTFTYQFWLDVLLVVVCFFGTQFALSVIIFSLWRARREWQILRHGTLCLADELWRKELTKKDKNICQIYYRYTSPLDNTLHETSFLVDFANKLATATRVPLLIDPRNRIILLPEGLRRVRITPLGNIVARKRILAILFLFYPLILMLFWGIFMFVSFKIYGSFSCLFSSF